MTSPLDNWYSQIDHAITTTLDAQAHTTDALGEVAQELMGPVRESVAGGKRMRPLLLLASHAAHGESQQEAAAHVAAALELFQTAALIHDDVLDDSDTRRGVPALHRRVEQVHAEQGWHASSEDFGEAGAVLAGDLALMASQRALTAGLLHLEPEPARMVAQIFSDMADMVTLGQYADMRAAVQPLSELGNQEADIRAVMRAKTASYTAEAPLALGAALAGASAVVVDEMKRAGLALGHAFQLRDDLLGLVGTPATTGKPTDGDIREGKRTLALWRAWLGTDDAGRSVLSKVVGDRNAADAAVAEVLNVIHSTDAFAWAEAEIAESAAMARGILAELDLTVVGAAALEELVTLAVDRDA